MSRGWRWEERGEYMRRRHLETAKWYGLLRQRMCIRCGGRVQLKECPWHRRMGKIEKHLVCLACGQCVE